jgi:choline dehydrogenase
MADSGAKFDYIVVGAGSSGCVLGNRLSAGGQSTVAVVEAGPRDRSFWIHLPIGYGRTMWDPAVNWKFQTEPEPNLGDRKIYWPRGRVLGGSSSINGLIVIRGQHEDYDRWARNCGNGWSWNEVLPYFIKIEHNPDHAGDQLHGDSGPQPVTSIGRRHELVEAFIASAEANGVPRTEDFNGRMQEGAGYFQLTTRNGWRISAAGAYLRLAEKRRNVRVFTDTQVIRVLFEGRQAVGVVCRAGAATHTIKARRGVILSAGAIQSPHLLMLSGIGPSRHLQEYGVPVLIDRAAVGQNLQDHLQFRLIYRCAKAITTNDALRSLWGRARLGLEWLLFRTGPLAIGINQGGMFARLMASSKTPDIQFHVATLSADIAGGNVPARELQRAKENLKGRILLSMESTSARMNRLGKSLITDSELLSLDRIVAEIDAVEASSVSELAAALLAPERLSAACIGPNDERFLAALEQITPGLARAA